MLITIVFLPSLTPARTRSGYQLVANLTPKSVLLASDMTARVTLPLVQHDKRGAVVRMSPPVVFGSWTAPEARARTHISARKCAHTPTHAPPLPRPLTHLLTFQKIDPSPRPLLFRRRLPQVLSGAPLTPASDVYAFAVVALELFSRQVGAGGRRRATARASLLFENLLLAHDTATLFPPFAQIGFESEVQDDGLDATLFRVISEDLRPKIPAEVPMGFARLIEACWATEPESRPTAAKARCALRRRAFSATRPSPLYIA